MPSSHTRRRLANTTQLGGHNKPGERQRIARELTDVFATSLAFADKRDRYGDIVARAVRDLGGDAAAVEAAREHAAAILDGFVNSNAGLAAAREEAAESASALAAWIADRREEERAATQPDQIDREAMMDTVRSPWKPGGMRDRARRAAEETRGQRAPTAAERAPTVERAAMVELMNPSTPRARRAGLRARMAGGG